MPAPLKPRAVLPGATIGICAPSSWVAAEDLAPGITRLEEAGFKVKVHPQVNARHHQTAGPHAQRLDALHDLFRDKSVDAILAAGGGNRALHLLDGLDLQLITQNPKPLIGFSDVTALLASIWQQTGLVTFHGPTLKWIGKGDTGPAYLAGLLPVLAGQAVQYDFTGAETVSQGAAQGQLVGGNLCLLSNLWGTRHAPDLTGKIVFVEDVDETIHNVDRMLLALKRIGHLERAAGLIVGNCGNLPDPGKVPFGLTLHDLVRELTADLDMPVVINAPFGHGPLLPTFPLGVQARLEAGPATSHLKLLESAVAQAKAA